MTTTTTPLTSATPVRPAHNVHRQILLLFEQAFALKWAEAVREGKIRVLNQPSSGRTIFIPRMDLFDDPASPNIVATFELPGVKLDDITLTIRDNHLMIEGNRSSPFKRQKTSLSPSPFYQKPGQAVDPPASDSDMKCDLEPEATRTPIQELRYGKFQRRVRLPAGVKPSDVKMDAGMLTVTWPRAAATKSKASSVEPDPVPTISSPISSLLISEPKLPSSPR